MKKILFVLLFLCICYAWLSAQTNTNPIGTPQIIQSTPEVAGMTKFGDIPVGEYTGTPDISIPLYVAKSGKLNLPITLSYHASGIQVSQEATWVGLGWNLLAGGCISYVPVGGNDQLYLPMTEWSDWQLLFGSNGFPFATGEDGYRLWNCVPGAGNDNATSVTKDQILSAALNGQGEQDLYSANFLGYSFKFILLPTHWILNGFPDTFVPFFLGNKNKFKIEFTRTSFTLTGEDGTTYCFTASETSNSSRSIYTDWLLTYIISPEGDQIRLVYSNGTTHLLPSLSERYTAGYPGCGDNNRVLTYSTTNNKYLDSIVTNREIIKFITSERTDISGTGAKKLSNIKVIDRFSGEVKKAYKFNYDYFTGALTGGNYLNDDSFWSGLVTQIGLTDDNIRKRLKLVSFSKNDSTDVLGENYSFSYFDSIPLPYKTSFSRDYWGYFNGENNLSDIIGNNATRTILPNLIPLLIATNNTAVLPDNLLLIKGATRSAREKFITTGMLKTISFPTGGKTSFEFEPHTFRNFDIRSASSFNDRYYAVHDNNNVTSSHAWDTLTIHSKTIAHIFARIRGSEGYFGLNELLNANISIIGPWGPNQVTHSYHLDQVADADFNSNGYLKTWTDDLILEPGHYTFACDFPDALGDLGYGEAPVAGTLAFRDYNPSGPSIGGGVRVKKVTNTDESGKVTNTKKYSYVNQDGLTSGKLLLPLNLLKIRSIMKGTPSNDQCSYDPYTAYYISADSYMPSACTTFGSNVGYDRVEITNTYGNTNNGKEIKYFTNDVPSIFFDYVPLYCYISDGDMVKHIYLSNSNDTIKKEIYTYSQIDQDHAECNAIVEDRYVGPTDAIVYGYCQCKYNPRFAIARYPVYNYRNNLVRKVETDYLNGLKIVNTIESSYNIDNYAISETRETKSDGNIHYSKYLYPEDFVSLPGSNGLIYADLVSRNIISPVILKTDSLTNSIITKLKTNYFYFGDSFQFLAPNSIEFQSGNNPAEERIFYDKYDNSGSLKQFHKADNIFNSFIYGYNGTLPVIKAENISYNDLATALSSITGNLDQILQNVGSLTNDTQKGTWQTFNSQLRNLSSLASVRLTTYTYDPLFGITSITDPNGIVTYYEYDNLGRLSVIRDHNNKILKEFRYHYLNQQ